MTGYIFAAIFLLAPLLQAVMDLPLLLAFQQAALLACLAWLFLRWQEGGLPRGLAQRRFYPLWAAAGLTLLALVFSPFRGYIFPEWGSYAAGLLIFLCASFLSDEERSLADRAVAAAAWAVFAVCLAQAFWLKTFAAHPPFTNLNALALYAVMMIPLALQRRDWALTGAMVILVVWTQSLGAALAGLTAAGFYAAGRYRSGELRGSGWLLAALGALGLLSFYLLQAGSVAGRLAWWRSAWEMFLASPATGFGCASFAWAQAAFQQAGTQVEHSLYAHNYYLEFLAENGLPAAAAWFWVLFAAARRKTGLAKYSVIAALAHSVVDFGLSVPANFWLFCYLLASPADAAPDAAPRRRLLPAALALAALLEAALLALGWRALAFERAKERALAAFTAGDAARAEAELRPELGRKLFRLPALELLGRLNLTAPDGGARAAVYFEMALLENRYSAFSWRALARIYSAARKPELAAGLERRRREVFR
ncbi:MAG: O-antigen ligase family protein [Elusimicrobiales bacterium]|nr:O-antigen ligase family protein [Elusimicrobiales bacterium]